MTVPARFITYLTRHSRTSLLLAGVALGTAGCAQQKSNPDYYAPAAESTITDATSQGVGAAYRNVVRAPSQVQIPLKSKAQKPQNVATAPDPGKAGSEKDQTAAPTASTPLFATEALIPQVQTYLGTLPCFSTTMQCTTQRITLTLAPNGRWRARLNYLNDAHQTVRSALEQGCWHVSGRQPSRITLLDPQGNIRADFSVSAHNVLRVRLIDGQTPSLNYHLSRQPDLDPINELGKNKDEALQCS